MDDLPRLPALDPDGPRAPLAPRQPRRPVVRPPRLRRPPVAARGPRSVQARRIHTGGPGQPPEGFILPTNSRSEWIWYWASMRVLDPDRDPRQPPFTGGRLWRYQSPQLGGYVRALGSAVVDFLYFTSVPAVVVRIVTYYWHLAAPSSQQGHDRIQLVNLADQFHVVDVYEQEFIGDETGESAVLLVKETLGLMRRTDPLAAGTTLFVRNPLTRAAARG